MVILSLLLSFFRLEMEGAQLSIISTNASDSQFIIQIGGVVDKLQCGQKNKTCFQRGFAMSTHQICY